MMYPFYSPVSKCEKAVICFEIAPEYRGKGVASALLNRVILDAKSQGYQSVVGFPVVRNERYEWDNEGPVRLYEKLGFVKEAEARQNERLTMRKELKD